VATTTSYYDADKQRQDHTEWHKVVIWGKRAQTLNDTLTKGTRVLVEGSIRTNVWEDKEGNKHKDVVINAEHVTPLNGNEAADKTSKQPTTDTGNQPASKPNKPQHRERHVPYVPPNNQAGTYDDDSKLF
jgi:single-strand DNA-binding protein